MPTSSTPPWAAQHAGLLGQADAIAGAGSINQMLGTHPGNQVYQGNPVLTPVGSGGTAWAYQLSTQDIDQPFTMSGTSIGRVVIPVLPVGGGADLIVSLCADNSGNPGTVITRTRIPASWINQLAAVSGVAGPSSQPPTTQYTNNPLAVSQFNTLHMGSPQTTAWSFPDIAPGFNQVYGAQTYLGDYFIVVGAANGSTFYDDVFTIQYDANGNLSQAVPQPAMPQVNNGSCALAVATDPSSGDATVVVAGGTTAGNVVTAAVYTAAFNPATGVISSWSAQTNLPQALDLPAAATWNGYVYVLGGVNAANTVDLNTVYYAQVQNGQITAWTATSPLPTVLDSMYAAAINGFLFVIGGENFVGTRTTATYYAPINSDGTLGAWQTGPSLPAGPINFQQGTPILGPFAVMCVSNGQMYVLGITESGPDIAWQTFTAPHGGFLLAEATVSPGTWIHYGLEFTDYIAYALTLTPRISVPLPTTGLTNGATYHLLLQQVGSDLNNYLRTHDDFDVFPGNPTLKTSPKNANTWTAGTSGHAIPLQIFDNSNSNATANGATGNNQIWHTWDDNGAKITTLVRATTPDQRLIGICEAAASPTALNANSGFESGVSPWTASNGTVTQSSAQAYEGQYSLLLTPTGGFTTAAALSEKVACLPGVSYTVRARAYSPGGYSNVDTQVNWYNSAGTFLSASSTVFNVPAAAWTDITAAFTAPANAYFAQIALQEAGSPGSGATIYFDQAWIYETYGGPQVATVAQITYAGTWPGSQLWPPTSVLQLA